jgi:hypothetical protein
VTLQQLLEKLLIVHTKLRHLIQAIQKLPTLITPLTAEVIPRRLALIPHMEVLQMVWMNQQQKEHMMEEYTETLVLQLHNE